MAKRFTATEIWTEDWFLSMPCSYKLFWFYMLSACDHAGLFKVNLRSFCGLNEVNVTTEKAIEYFNSGKERIRIVNQSLWLIEDFFSYQYGHTFNPNNRLHESIGNLYNKANIKLTSIRGLTDLKEGVKDKDKDKVKYIKEQNEKNIHGEYFDLRPGKKMVRMSDGKEQSLTDEEYLLAKEGKIEPNQVLKH